jgi:photosystem II stability/assembly factor-like uncharacterized protein
MPKPTNDEVITQQNRRLYFQDGGPLPNNTVKYAGVETQYMVLEGVTRPIRGGIEPIRVYDPLKLKRFKTVGRKTTAPDFPTATLRVLEKRGALPFQLGDLSCPHNIYLPNGYCDNPSDFLNGWSDFVEICSWAEATEVDEGDRMAWEDDNQAEDSISETLEAKYAIGKLGFGAEAASEISREVIDVVYGSALSCGDCGPNDDGTQRIYAVSTSSGAASPGLPAEIIYTLNGGSTWTQSLITSFGATEAPLAIDILGDKLVVLGDDAYYWATINKNTGVPGTFTKVTTGIVAANTPLDMYVLGTKLFICGVGGYVYRVDDLSSGATVVSAGDATTNDLYRIHGDGGETIVCVGGNSDVIVSTNRGATWGATIAEPSAIALNITALFVKTDKHWWVGTSTSGRLYYTLNGGETWTHVSFTGAGVGAVNDIYFATDEVGYFSHADNTPTAYLWTTWNGGANWVRNDGGSSRLLNFPAALDKIGRIATPSAHVQTDSNNVALACLAGDGSDGTLLLGIAAEF